MAPLTRAGDGDGLLELFRAMGGWTYEKKEEDDDDDDGDELRLDLRGEWSYDPRASMKEPGERVSSLVAFFSWHVPGFA